MAREVGSQRRSRTGRMLAPLIVAATLAAHAPGARAEDAAAGGADPPSHHAFVGFPDTDLYPHYVADPLRAQSAVMLVSVLDSAIPESGDGRFILRLGGSFSLFRVHPTNEPNHGLQLDFKGGFFGHFDTDYSLDNIGWDGLYGLTLAWRPTDVLAFRVGTLHDSAHVGDEYAERTGRTRIGYTRQEWIAGLTWSPRERWRAYAEAGYGFSLAEFQEPLRLQAGAEVTGARRFWNERANWYTAFDLGAWEERDWDTRLTAQIGIMIATGHGRQRYRLALEYADGRSALGEFSEYDESTLGIGWYFDF